MIHAITPQIAHLGPISPGCPLEFFFIGAKFFSQAAQSDTQSHYRPQIANLGPIRGFCHATFSELLLSILILIILDNDPPQNDTCDILRIIQNPD